MLFLGVAAVLPPTWVSHSSPPSTSTKPPPVTARNLTRESNSTEEKSATLYRHVPRSIGFCPCGRRHVLMASSAAILLPVSPWKEANSSAFESNGFLEKFRPARPDWYEGLYARAMEEGMRSYEAEVAGYKADLFSHFTETTKKILELGVGTGPNFKYYPRAADFHVVGIDPNKQMEKFARRAALASGLPQTNFAFMQGIGEYLPVEDGYFDAVIGTLVLCSVKDVSRTLQEVRRVLKAGGLYFFIEHVAAPVYMYVIVMGLAWRMSEGWLEEGMMVAEDALEQEPRLARWVPSPFHTKHTRSTPAVSCRWMPSYTGHRRAYFTCWFL